MQIQYYNSLVHVGNDVGDLDCVCRRHDCTVLGSAFVRLLQPGVAGCCQTIDAVKKSQTSHRQFIAYYFLSGY